jgi:hypothetical protein
VRVQICVPSRCQPLHPNHKLLEKSLNWVTVWQLATDSCPANIISETVGQDMWWHNAVVLLKATWWDRQPGPELVQFWVYVDEGCSDCALQGCNFVWSCRQIPTFQRNMVLQFHSYLETKDNTVALKGYISCVSVQTEHHFLNPSPSLWPAYVTESVPHAAHINHEDAGNMFPQNTGYMPQDSMLSQPRSPQAGPHRLLNIIFDSDLLKQ